MSQVSTELQYFGMNSLRARGKAGNEELGTQGEECMVPLGGEEKHRPNKSH